MTPFGKIDDTALMVIKSWLIQNDFVGFTITGKDDLMVTSDKLVEFLESITYKNNK